MRIFVAGSTGVLGTRLVPLLVADGHDLWGMTRSPSKVDLVRRLDAEPVVCDVFDLATLRREVAAIAPHVIVHLLTDLPDEPSSIDSVAAANARIRRDGTANLLTAARAGGVRSILAESVAWTLPGDAGRAVDELERAVLNVGGIVLRYGQLYGPGTWFERELPNPPRVQVDEAARRTAMALGTRSGVVTIVDPTG